MHRRPSRRSTSRSQIAALASVLLAAGCGGAGAPRSETDRNVLHLYMESDPASLDPIQAVDVYRGRMVVYLFDGLVQYEGNEIAPNLAERWEVSEDGRAYTFHLRDDVAFHNGRMLVAEDVRYSFERALRPESQSPLTWVFDFIDGAGAVAAGEADELRGVQVLDPHTVRITLSQPYAPFLSLLAMPAAHIVPREEIEQKGAGFSEAPIGTGPWVFESWAHDDVLRLTANPRYHGGRPKTDGMEIRIIPETTTVIAELESGNIDWADLNEFPKPEYERFVQNPDWEPHVHTRPALVTYYLALNNGKEKFADPRVRQALNYAVDVATIAKAIYPGEMIVSHGPIPPGLPGFREDGQPYGHDPSRARDLLAEAGAEGLAFDVYFRSLALNQRFLEAVQANLAEVGVTMNLQQRDWTAVRQAMDKGELDAYLANWYADYPDAENFLYPLFYSGMAGAGGNAAFYSSAAVDSLILQARRTLDDEERIGMYARADSLIQADAPWIFTVHPVDADIVQPWLEGYEMPRVFYANKWLDVGLRGGEELAGDGG